VRRTGDDDSAQARGAVSPAGPSGCKPDFLCFYVAGSSRRAIYLGILSPTVDSVSRSLAPLALCLALLRHPSGLGPRNSWRPGLTPAASTQVAVARFLADRDQEIAGQIADFDLLGSCLTLYQALWLAPPESIETGVVRTAHSRHTVVGRCVAELSRSRSRRRREARCLTVMSNVWLEPRL
jgi:hypothetical protein